MGSNEYIKEWRRTTPTGQAALKRQKARDKARRRALKALIARHKMDWIICFGLALRDQEKIDEMPKGAYGSPDV